VSREGGEHELDAFRDSYPEFWSDELLPFFRRVYEVAGLDTKTTELIVTSLLALRGWETGIRVHALQALDAGATEDEVRGAVLITLVLGGIHRAAAGLNVVEQALATRRAGGAGA